MAGNVRRNRENLLEETQAGLLAARRDLAALHDEYDTMKRNFHLNKTTLSVLMRQQDSLEADNLQLLNVIELLTNISAGIDVAVNVS